MKATDELGAPIAAANKRKLLADLLRRKASQLRQRYTQTPEQRELWIANELDRDAMGFYLGMAVRIVSAVDVAAMRSAGQHLIDRHVLLRSLYRSDGETPYFEVHGSMEVALEHVDASSWDDIRMYQEVRRRFVKPFDLATGPILRITLFTRAPGDSVFSLLVHEIACDGTSMEILLREFIQFYQAECQGLAVVSAPPSFEFTDYVRLYSEAISGASARATSITG